jgi:hypothetical protein
MKTAPEYLATAKAEMEDRAASRDVGAERSMAKAVAAFNVLYSRNLTETEGWQFMSLLKKSRGAQGAYREDDYIDDVAYCALAAECEAGVQAERERCASICDGLQDWPPEATPYDCAVAIRAGRPA